MNSNSDSTTSCHALGTSLAFETAMLYKVKANIQDKAASRDEFVKEKSNPPGRVKGINLMIVNCSRGEKNINFVIFFNLKRLKRDLNSYLSNLQFDTLPYAIQSKNFLNLKCLESK